MQQRIEELDAFYTAHVDDERSILFDKQRLKLRKLLHEYDEAVRNLQSQSQQQQYGSSAASQSQYQQNYAQPQAYDYPDAQQSGMMTRQIREDSRLTMAELLSWFTQAGAAEMPELSVPVLESLFGNVTRTNLDGKMSIRDLRQWYISYGKRALRSGVSNFSGEVVPTALVKQPHGGKGGAAGLRNSKELSRALYEWEKDEASARPATAAGGPLGPIALPNHMLEFQVRMSEAEYQVRAHTHTHPTPLHSTTPRPCADPPSFLSPSQAFSARRRQYEAELRYKERIARGAAVRAHGQRDRLAAGGNAEAGDGYTISGLHDGSSYREPVSAASYAFRA